MEGFPKIKYNGNHLVAYMPNGDLIPMQTDIKITNNTEQRNIALVTVEFEADISELVLVDPTIPERRVESLKKEISDLKDTRDLHYKSAKFWENLYEKETSKKWYQKLFNI
ncbi:MAG: hypothetical protein V4497_09350 [Bacteroidota bacterium]